MCHHMHVLLRHAPHPCMGAPFQLLAYLPWCAHVTEPCATPLRGRAYQLSLDVSWIHVFFCFCLSLSRNLLHVCHSLSASLCRQAGVSICLSPTLNHPVCWETDARCWARYHPAPHTFDPSQNATNLLMRSVRIEKLPVQHMTNLDFFTRQMNQNLSYACFHRSRIFLMRGSSFLAQYLTYLSGFSLILPNLWCWPTYNTQNTHKHDFSDQHLRVLQHFECSINCKGSFVQEHGNTTMFWNCEYIHIYIYIYIYTYI